MKSKALLIVILVVAIGVAFKLGPSPAQQPIEQLPGPLQQVAAKDGLVTSSSPSALSARAGEEGASASPGIESEAASADWRTLIESPRDLLRAACDGTHGTKDLSDSEALDFAKCVARAMLATNSMLDEESEEVNALRRLPSAVPLAQLAGVELTPDRRRVIEQMHKKYEQRLKGPIELATLETNAMCMSQFDLGKYSVYGHNRNAIQTYSPDYPPGKFRWSSTMPCMRTPYTVEFSFNSGAYPSLENTFQEIADIKLELKEEVLGYLSAFSE